MKKIFLIFIMLITTLVPNKFDENIDFTNDIVNQNTTEEKEIIELKKIQQDEEIIEPKIDENIENEVIDEVVKDEEIKQENNKPVRENKTSKTKNSNNSSQMQPKVKIQNKTEAKTEPTPEPIEEQKPVEQPKTEIKQKQEEKIYCVDGGKTHIYGDGANEHGYYKTWDEAFKAYEDYTRGWDSTQFKVDQCACGLYYFWVIK